MIISDSKKIDTLDKRVLDAAVHEIVFRSLEKDRSSGYAKSWKYAGLRDGEPIWLVVREDGREFAVTCPKYTENPIEVIDYINNRYYTQPLTRLRLHQEFYQSEIVWVAIWGDVLSGIHKSYGTTLGEAVCRSALKVILDRGR